MQKYYILLVSTIVLNLSTAKADHLRDSIGVENLNGKKLILHKIAAKDTYYSLGRRYGVTPKEIMTYNENKFLQIGVLIKVPTQKPFAETNSPAPVTAGTPRTTSTTDVPVSDNTEIIEYAVQKKDNLNKIAEKYGTTVEEIKRVSNLRSINLQIGQVLKIPAKQGFGTDNIVGNEAKPDAETYTNKTVTAQTTVVPQTPTVTPPATTTTATPKAVTSPFQVDSQYKKPLRSKKQEAAAAKPVKQEELLVHTVGSNETMYSIATTYDLTLDQLKAKNNLTTNSLYIGQKLLIRGQYPVRGLNGETDENDIDSIESVKNPSLRLPPSRYGLSQLDEKGTGTWIVDPDLDSSKMLVLHRTAPLGTIMKITNPMSNRSTFAKVVGKFTENESTKDVIIVMTKAVADALGALDKRFFCNLTYSGQANEQ